MLILAMTAWAQLPTPHGTHTKLALSFQVTGVTGDVKTNVENALKNQQALLTYPLNETEIYRFHRESTKTVKKALEPFGYFRASVDARLANTEQKWVEVVNIKPGPQMRIAHISVRISGPGQEDHTFTRFLKRLPIKVDDPLSAKKFQNLKDRLFQHASHHGYFNARMTKAKMIINLIRYRASIIIRFNTGIQYRFGDTLFNKTPFSLKFLERFLTYHEHQPYNYRLLVKTQSNLLRSNYFNHVVVTPLTTKAKHGMVPIEIHLATAKSQHYQFGVGYGTDTGIRGTFGVNLRRLNAWGHRFNLLAQAAAKGNSSLVANYSIPGANPATDHFNIAAGIGELRFDSVGGTNSSRSAKVSLSYTSQLGNWLQTIALTYLNERYTLPSFNLPPTTANVLYPSIQWSYTRVNRAENPTQGITLHIQLAGAPNFLAKNNSGFFQARVSARALLTLHRNTRFLLRGEVAHTAINNLTNLPLSLQLFAGGANSIRGFPYNNLGPGRNLYVFSVELQQRVHGNWFLAGFIDAGTVNNNNNPFLNIGRTLSQFSVGVGPAIVWDSPLGTLELGVGTPIKPNINRWIVAFSMGPLI